MVLAAYNNGCSMAQLSSGLLSSQKSLVDTGGYLKTLGKGAIRMQLYEGLHLACHRGSR